MKKIRVLQDTPFNMRGDELSVADFRIKYSYACVKDVSDDSLIAYLNEERELYLIYRKTGNCMGYWFEIVDSTSLIPDLPERLFVSGHVYIRKH